MDHKIVSFLNLWQHPVNGKLIVILAQGSRDIVFMVAGSVLLSKHCNMVIRAIHCRAHQIDCTRVYSDIIFVRVLFMNCFCHKASVRSHHVTSKLCVNLYITHSCRDKHFLVYLSNPLTNRIDIIRLLIRSVWDTDSSGKVDKFDVYSCFFGQSHRLLKKYFCQHRIVVIGNCIACKKRMKAELFRPLAF